MTRRRAAIALALAVALVCAAVGAGAAAGAATPPRSPAAGAHVRAASAGCATKRLRAQAACRRARSAAAYRRGARRGRALLSAAPSRAPGRATPPVAGAPGTATATPSPPAGTGTGAVPPPGGTPPGVASSVGAEAHDFGTFVLRLTRTAVPAGELTIYFRNYDIADHNLWLDPPPATSGAPVIISEAVGENGGATRTVPVTPGTWRLYCSLLGHGSMTRDLAVQ